MSVVKVLENLNGNPWNIFYIGLDHVQVNSGRVLIIYWKWFAEKFSEIFFNSLYSNVDWKWIVKTKFGLASPILFLKFTFRLQLSQVNCKYIFENLLTLQFTFIQQFTYDHNWLIHDPTLSIWMVVSLEKLPNRMLAQFSTINLRKKYVLRFDMLYPTSNYIYEIV